MRESAPSQEDISAAIPPTELPGPQVYNEDSSPSGGLNGGPMILQDPAATSPPFFLKDLLPNSEPGGGSRPRDIDWHIMDDASCAWDNFMSFDDELEVFDDAPQGVLADYLVPATDHSPNGEITTSDDCVGRRKTTMAACVGAKAFNTSIWHWTPRHGEFVSEEEPYLSLSRGILSGDDDIAGMPPLLQGRILCDSDRDRIVSLVLTFCDQSNLASIAPSLPSLGVMERLICRFLQFQTEGPVPWFHVPTFCARGAPEEILLGMIAYGASLMPVRALQKLGTALPNILLDALRSKARFELAV
ncbi:c2h2 type zinc finger domain [Fusarium albosuccineum]|uniref:C2h2 type zinc finger domain n=1 Tax=Fusarium albosuccineum TaxID=1237068 RepID=A0A8H4L5U1_9HYPO|nr:c2h2 type zinc finger domain [Fusarium albosuccineum]